ncbi:MAG: substrate-binding domain-containing protein [Bacteroidota bacterium]|nr:substrate-binding domain-containing protein [Bacteroidota bacterium]
MRFYLLSLIVIMYSCVSDDGTIKLKGSDTEVNLAVTMAETYRTENKSILVSVSGGGSGLGIASLLNGNADIANSSRAINSEELSLFQKKSIPLDSFIFAQDAIAFVVSDKLPIDSIHVNELKKVLSGEYKNWSVLTTKKLPINIYGRQSNSGTYDFVKKKLKIQFSPYAKQMNGNAQILEAIKVDNSGIGYVGAGYIMKGYENGIKILTIYTDYSQATSPLDAEKIAANSYFFQRPLYQYYRTNNYQKIKPFLDFEKSDAGKKIILTSGYYPILK